jgi:hypothetical protein
MRSETPLSAGYHKTTLLEELASLSFVPGSVAKNVLPPIFHLNERKL